MSIPAHLLLRRSTALHCTGCGLEVKRCDCGHRGTSGTAGRGWGADLRNSLDKLPDYSIDKRGVVSIPRCRECGNHLDCDCAEIDAEIAKMKDYWKGRQTQ